MKRNHSARRVFADLVRPFWHKRSTLRSSLSVVLRGRPGLALGVSTPVSWFILCTFETVPRTIPRAWSMSFYLEPIRHMSKTHRYIPSLKWWTMVSRKVLQNCSKFRRHARVQLEISIALPPYLYRAPDITPHRPWVFYWSPTQRSNLLLDYLFFLILSPSVCLHQCQHDHERR